MNLIDAEQAIRSCFLFSDARAEDIKALANASFTVNHHKGEELFMAGDPADGLRVVLSGLVRIWVADSEGQELTLTLLEDGDPFGEIALLDGLTRTANATSLESTKCLFLPSSAVEPIMARDPALALHVIRLLCELLRRNTETVSDFAFRGLRERLAQKLNELAMTHALLENGEARFQRKFSQSDLAQMLGVTREAVNKRFKALIHDGIVQTIDGYIVIPDLKALKNQA